MSILPLKVTRDSVAAGDDADAPHERHLRVDAGTPLDVIISHAASGYLALIAGGYATWVALLDGEPIAVLAQQWQCPRLLVEPARHRGAVSAGHLHFAYEAQHDPDAVLRSYTKR